VILAEAQKTEAIASFTSRDMRDALGMFPTGVAVITALTAEGEGLGATVSSFNSVSLDPPLILFSLAREAKSIGAWKGAKQFAVSVLGEHQSQISTRFARALTDKWDGVAPVAAKTIKAPLIRDALAWFECEAWAVYDGGDHLIIVGRVVHLERIVHSDPRPLVFSGGRYRRLDPGTPIETPYEAAQWLHGW
jgi:flavin reductase (DIM6/NTAB) family NADH-FMN oxidoreductase RutF